MNNGFGERLRELRKEKGLTQAALAAQCGVNRVAIVRYENGTRKQPSYLTAVSIANALGVPVTTLMGESAAVTPDDLPGAVPIVKRFSVGEEGATYESVAGYAPANVSDPAAYFFFRVADDSMAPEIRAGDMALIRKQDEIKGSQPALIVLDGQEPMLRRVCRHGDVLVLQAFDAQTPPRIFAGDEREAVHIVGRVVKTERTW